MGPIKITDNTTGTSFFLRNNQNEILAELNITHDKTESTLVTTKELLKACCKKQYEFDKSEV